MTARRALVWLSSCAVACGARSSLETTESGGAGSVAQGGSAGEAGGIPSGGGGAAGGSGGGGGGGGGGGIPFVCGNLEWAGDAVHVPIAFGNSVARPRLVDVGGGDVGLVIDAIGDAIGDTVASVKISQPFGSWPPPVGSADANFPAQGRFGVSSGDPGLFAFAAPDGTGNLVLGQAAPGQNGSTFVSSPTGAQGVHFLARNAIGAYLLGQGWDSYATVIGFSSFSPDISPHVLGTVGCADPLFASAIASGPDFIVGSVADQPFDDCADPDLPGPPLYLQTQRYTIGMMGMIPGDFVELEGPAVELAIAPATGGAWLGVRMQDQADFQVRFTDESSLSISDIVAHFVGPQTNMRHAIASAGDTLAVVELIPNEAQPGGDLIVGVYETSAFVSLSAFPLGVFPTGEPAILPSPNEGSFLVAFPEEGVAGNSIALVRADCLD